MELLQNREKLRVDQKEIDKLKSILEEKVKKEGINFIYKKKWPYLLGIILGGIAGLVITFLIFNLGSNQTTKIIALVVLGLTIISVLVIFKIYMSQRRKITKHNQSQAVKFVETRTKTFIDWFNTKFDDVKIEKKLSKQEVWNEYVRRLRMIPTNVWMNGRSFQSRVIDVAPGYLIRSDHDVLFGSFVMHVRETHVRRIYNTQTKRWETEVYYKFFQYMCIVVDNIPTKWKQFSLFVAPGKNKKPTLENDYFNKKWKYQASDPVKLRMLLTPWVQEQLLKTNFKYTFEHHGNITYWHGIGELSWFSLDLQIMKTLEETMSTILKDIVGDFEILQNLIQDLSIYKLIIT